MTTIDQPSSTQVDVKVRATLQEIEGDIFLIKKHYVKDVDTGAEALVKRESQRVECSKGELVKQLEQQKVQIQVQADEEKAKIDELLASLER